MRSPRRRSLLPLLALQVLPLVSPGAAEPVETTVDAAAQAGGARVFRHVTDSGNVWLGDVESLPDNWAADRWEGILEEYADWFHLSSNASDETLWRKDGEGGYVFVPDPKSEPRLRETLRAGLRPRVVMATSNIPEPLIEGGFKAGHYGFNVRQPNDYAAWQAYLESLFQWLADTFGRDAVRNWHFTFGVEADWQAECIDPETGERMDVAENRREFMKMFDHFHAALVNVLGPGVYAGIYGAFETQADDYLEHWAEGTNFATGERGTRAGYFGFSDWYLINHVEDYSPFDRAGEALRRETGEPWSAMASIAAGFLWKYEHIARAADRHPGLAGLEVSLPEHGYFDTRGGIRPDGSRGAADYLPADHRGATLFALRLIAYAQAPRLAWVNPRWLLGPDNFSGNAREDVRPPRFHALRISKRLDGQRILPVEGGKDTPGGNEVRLLATAADDGSGRLHLLAVNFNPDFEGGSAETVRIRLDHLPVREGTGQVKLHRIDAAHNNWWKDWTAHRRSEGINYVYGQGSTHLGKALELDPKYRENHLYVMATTDREGYREWLRCIREYREVDGLQVTEDSEVTIRDGSLVFEETLPPNGTLYMELTLPGETDAADLLRQDWRLSGAARGGSGSPLEFAPGPQTGAGARLELGALEPDAPYAVIAEVEAPVRMLEFSIRATDAEGGTVSSRAPSEAGVRRLVLTGRSNGTGRMGITMEAPPQPWEAGDTIAVRALALKPLYDSIK